MKSVREAKGYGPLTLTFDDRELWNLSNILSLRARETPQKTFLTEGSERFFSFADMDDLATRIANGLHKRGVLPGERMMILLDNCAEYVLAWFGASRAGVVEVPTNTEYFGEFLAHAIRLTSPRAIVVGTNYVERLCNLASLVGEIGAIAFVVGNDAKDGIKQLTHAGLPAERFEDLLASDNASGISTPQSRYDLGGILFTSGTTGPSKGVMMSHAQLYFFADQCVNLVRLGPDDVYMTGNPLFHGNAQFLTVYPALIAGASVALYERFSPSKFGERLQESGATVTNFVGVMMDWVAKSESAPEDANSKLRCVFAAPTAWSVLPQLRTRFGIDAFVEVFGQTEICLPIMTPYGLDRPPGSAGLAVDDWFEIRLTDPDTDDPVPQGEVGELLVRTKEPWILNSGYFGMPVATAEARRNLWFHTGDGLRCDDDGWYYFVDRLKDCLRRRGENISSFEVEQPILQHPQVAACAAVGVRADEEAGEDEVAIIVVSEGNASLDPDEIIAWADERMPSFLVPRYVQFVDKLPTTPSGKVRKAELRDEIAKEHAWDRLASTVVPEKKVRSPRGATKAES